MHRARRRLRLPGLLRRGERDTAATEADLRAIFNGLPAMVGYWDTDLCNRLANDAYRDFVGRTPEQLRGTHLRDILGPERFPKHYPHMVRVLAGEPQVFESKIVGDDGNVRHTQVHYTPDLVDGEVRGFFVLVTDITARRTAERALEAAEARFRTLFEFAPIGTLLVDDQGRLVDVNRAAAELFGYTREALLGMRVSELTHPEDVESSREYFAQLFAGELDSYRIEKRYLHAGGHTIWAELNVTALPNDPDQGPIALGQIQDVSERRNHEAQLRELADRDALSGLFNHRAFMLHVERQAATAARHEIGGALLLIDLDGFKQVNDRCGHQAGDELIIAVAELLTERVRATDVVGRIGGDEFAVISPHGGAEQARVLGESLRGLLRGIPSRRGVRVEASIGVAAFTPERSAQEVLAAADAAMYRAKGAGGDRVAVDEARA